MMNDEKLAARALRNLAAETTVSALANQIMEQSRRAGYLLETMGDLADRITQANDDGEDCAKVRANAVDRLIAFSDLARDAMQIADAAAQAIEIHPALRQGAATRAGPPASAAA